MSATEINTYRQEGRTCVVYCRTSTGAQKDSETIKAQRRTCERLIRLHGLQVLAYGPKSDGWLIDDGISGRGLEGRGFAKLIDDIRARRVRPDAVVVYSVSRLMRADTFSGPEVQEQSAVDEARINSVLRSHGVKVIDTKGEHVDIRQALHAASIEVAEIRERTMDGKARYLSEGKEAKGGRPPYGYMLEPFEGYRKRGLVRVPDPEDGPRVRQILEWYVEGGTYHAARMATKAKYRTPMHGTKRKNAAKTWTPTRWVPKTIETIIDHVEDYLGSTAYIFGGEKHTLEYEPLIDGELVGAVQRRKRERKLKARATFLSTGFCDCACGDEGHIHARNSHDKHYARCSKGCGSVHQASFEKALWTATVCRMIQIERAKRAPSKDEAIAAQLVAAKGRVAEVQGDIDRLLDLYMARDIDKAEWKPRNEALKDQRAQAAAEVLRLEGEQTKRVKEETLASRMGGIIRDVWLDTTDLEKQREALGDLLDGKRVIVGWGERSDELRGMSTHATLTFPAFGDVPAATVRTDRDIWNQMLPGLVVRALAKKSPAGAMTHEVVEDHSFTKTGRGDP